MYENSKRVGMFYIDQALSFEWSAIGGITGILLFILVIILIVRDISMLFGFIFAVLIQGFAIILWLRQ